MRRCCLLLVCLLLLTGCGRADTQDVSSFAPAEGDRLVIFTSHKETIYEPILKEFEQRTGIWVELETGGTVPLLERIAAGESGADLMFGGGAWDTVTAFFVGLLIEWVTLLMDKFHMQTLVATLAGGFLAAFLPMAVNRLTGALVVEAAVAGALMPMLPGLAMTNAVQDTMRGDMVSGISSAVSAAMSAVLLAVGALAGVPAPADGRCGMSYEPLGQGLWYFLTSFVGTLGFAILLHAPKRAWLPASLIGAMTYTLYWSLKQLSLDEAASMFLAALFGSLLAQFCARKMRMIATIFLLLSVVALVPGLGLYRCMEQLGHQQYALGAQTGILTMAGILMMALGIGVGSFLFKLVVSGTKKIMPGGKQK